MSNYKPITSELRKYATVSWDPWPDARDRLYQMCDRIDAVHAGLERENAELKAELDRVLGEQEEHAHTRGESITDELREYAEDWDWLDTGAERAQDRIEAIADRIDAEHERQLEVLYRDMSDAEYVKLHKDTGGEYIHEYDKVDWRDHAGTWHENATVVAVCNDGCYVMDGTVFHVHKFDIRHHHAPTVEDVLQELVIDWDCAPDGEDKADVLKEYAAKLQLKEDE